MGRRRTLTGLAGLAALVVISGVRTAPEALFEIETLRVAGRPLQVLAADLVGRGAGGARDLVVASVSGTPPDERRWLSVFLAGGGGGERFGGAPLRALELAPEVVAFDVAQADSRPGAELALLDDTGLELVAPLPEASPRRRVTVVGLPFPPRTRDLSHLPMIHDWNADGEPAALIPTLAGGRLVRLSDGATRELSLPLVTEYWTEGWETPPQYGYLRTAVDWPILARADDDADGRADLFALSRFGVWVYRATSRGLAASPHRRMSLRPFSADEELRFQTTEIQIFARDLDADGLADLVVHTTSGALASSRAVISVHHNAGNGASLDPKTNLRVAADGLASLELVDLDGDGRIELAQGILRFGVIQAVRVLLTRTARVELRVISLSGSDLDAHAVTWTGEIPLHLDFAGTHVKGLLPTVDGDWNGDGLRDLLFGRGRTAIEIRLGSRGPAGPGFDGPDAVQPSPAAELARVADLDADGLDDLVIWDPRDAEGRVHVLHNRGVLGFAGPRAR